MCGGNDLLKQDGVFVCQFCGCKYSIEEAKKLIVEGPIDVSGSTVKIDNKGEIENLLIRAQQFFENKEYDTAELYYNRVLDMEATNPEALFGLEKTNKIITSPNLHISRGNPRGSGEGKTDLIIDGKKQKNVDLDYPLDVKLSLGNHTVEFKRAAVRSEVVNINITGRKDCYSINFKPKVFKIDVSVITK